MFEVSDFTDHSLKKVWKGRSLTLGYSKLDLFLLINGGIIGCGHITEIANYSYPRLNYS